MTARYLITDLNSVEPVDCPCGQARRAFLDDESKVASLHIVESSGDAKPHYHKRTTEIYYILEGEGHIELDDESFGIKPGMSILIKPGCRHRTIGEIRFVNIPIPAFDPADEWFD